MKVLVPVKRVIDYNVKVRVKADGSGVDLANVKMSMKGRWPSATRRWTSSISTR
ncbi:Electron transfer flavoprotein, beta subunit (plasmid) [Salipiger profundus]|uniref:Electron transfer flavoprotein, beta subunit n=1 Tax=Salipiger profundus TaxID=1229727 RepID=A0A1U7DDE7_9RHOB|nr:Electron transfer flavoprotein, beta subunit [Salipiger profundus]